MRDVLCYGAGDLESHLKQEGERKMFTPEVVRHVTAQVLLGLWYLHGKGCMYRDLKPGNVMLDKRGQRKHRSHMFWRLP